MLHVRLTPRPGNVLAAVLLAAGLSGLLNAHTESAATRGTAAPAADPGPGRLILPLNIFGASGLDMINPDGTRRVTVMNHGIWKFRFVTVAAATGMIAFASDNVGDTIPGPLNGQRIFVVNADGTGLRQVSFYPGQGGPGETEDYKPVISPDGTKVAFLSRRTAGLPLHTCSTFTGSVQLLTQPEVFVVNVDGTGLSQVTQPVYYDDGYLKCAANQTYAVAWGPDSQQLALVGFKKYQFKNQDPPPGLTATLPAVSVVGVGGGTEQVIAVDPKGNDSDNKDPIGKATIGGTFIEWAPGSRILFDVNLGAENEMSLGFVSPGGGGVSLTPMQDLVGEIGFGGATDNKPHGGSINALWGAVRYSPDGARLLFSGTSPLARNDRAYSLFIDNGRFPVPNTSYYFGPDSAAWAPGPPIPTPARLVLAPSPLTVYAARPEPIAASLLDAQGNVIVRAALVGSNSSPAETCPNCGYVCDATDPTLALCSGNRPAINLLGVITADPNKPGAGNICGMNAGLRACIPYQGSNGPSIIGITATQPAARTSGAGGPGVFTVQRNGRADLTEPVLFQFAVGGSAQRDLDYALDATGTTLPIPVGQSSVTIKVTPLRNQGNKTVILTLQPSAVGYVIDFSKPTATVTITDDGPPPGLLTLSSISPKAGGAGGRVTAIIQGRGIEQNATVRLTRAGQTDIVGTSPNVTAGLSLQTVFDLTSKAQGAWSVVVTNPGGASVTLVDGFTVEALRTGEVWADVVGRVTMRSGRQQQMFIGYGNTGNTDAPATHIQVTLPKSVFTISSLPLSPDGARPFVIHHDEEDLVQLQFLVRGVPAGSVNYLPFGLLPLRLTRFEISIRSFSSSKLQSIADRVANPTASLSAQVTESSPNSVKLAVRAVSGSRTLDATAQIDVKTTTEPHEPFVDVTDGGNTYTLAATRPRGTPSDEGVRAAMEDSQPPLEPIDPVEYTDTAVKITSLVNPTVDLLDDIQGLHGATTAAKERRLLVDYLKRAGLVDDAEVANMNRMIDGAVAANAVNVAANGLPPSPANLVIKEFDAVVGVMDGAWEFRLWNQYRTDPDWQFRYGQNIKRSDLPGIIRQEAYDVATGRKTVNGEIIASTDPNDKIGSPGPGTQHFIRGTEPVNYVILFENKPSATAPAQDVFVSDQLDVSKFDLSTFQLGSVNFGSTSIAPSPGSSQWTTDVDLRPKNNLIVRITAGLDVTTGLARWSFISLDPVTMLPTEDPLAGFLPPNTDANAPAGQGSVVFTVMPKSALQTGAEIRNGASIVFDANAPIVTPTWLNTIDKTAPTSTVTALPATQSTTSFPVQWSGSDAGAGIASYSVYVSENSKPFTSWLLDTTATTATFAGDVNKTYAFYSIARDGAGNLQTTPTAGQASTTISLTAPSGDLDGDTLGDNWERQFGVDPTTAIGLNGAAGDPDGDGRSNAQELASGTHPRGFFVQYLAEGATGTFFNTRIALANADAAQPGLVLLRFLRADGTTGSHHVTVPPLARRTIDVATVAGMATAEFSTIVESDHSIVTDRTMQWDRNGYGSHAETAIPAPAHTWYLAEGATHSGFDLFYLVQNPTATAANIEVTYLLPAPASPIVKTYTVAPNSRFNIWVDQQDARLASTDVSAVVTSASVPIIVERAMYLNAGGLPFGAGHNSAGITTPATRWFLAEGATGTYFDLFVLIANPNATDAAVEARYLLPDGSVVTRTYTVAARSRFNIWVDFEEARLADTAVSTTLTSTNNVPIIVERAMWWPNGPATWQEAHNSPGSVATGTRWGLAEGEVGGPSNTETYILIANTSATAGFAKVTLLFEDGTTAERTFPLNPNSRFNIAVASDFPAAVGKRFGAVVESVGTTLADIVVERAMYSNANGVVWAAGTNALGTRLR